MSLLAAQQAVTRAFVADGPPRVVRGAVMRALVETLRFDFGAVWILSEDRARISCADTHSLSPEPHRDFRTLTEGISFVSGTGPVGSVQATGQALWIEDAPADPSFLRAAAAERAGLRTMVAVPCPEPRGTAAVLELLSAARRTLDPELLAMLEEVGVQLGRYLEREERTERRRMLLSATDGVPDVIALMDRHGQVFEVNDAGRRLLAVGAGDLPPGCQLPMPQWAKLKLAASVIPAVSAGGPWTGESALRAENGREVPMLLTIVPHRSSDGTLRHVSAWFRDVGAYTAAKRREWESEKLDALSRLSGQMANDFNNVLTVIAGYSHLVADTLATDDPRREQLDELDQAARQAAALVHQLAPLVRDNGIRAPVDLAALVGDMTRLMKSLAGPSIEIVIARSTEVGFVHADPVQLEQVIVNLVLNARDALPRGGRISVGLSNVRAPGGGVPDSVPGGQYVLLTVSDNGVGMDGATRSRLFEPFFTTKPHARGLGLAAVFGSVRTMGGHIAVDSEPGRGAAFRIYLPRVDAATIPVADPKRTRDHTSRNETVLVVEDEAGVRALARRALERHGYRVLEADCGAAALELCRRHGGPIHLLITDVVMPGMDGRELAEQVVLLRPDTRVLYMSGHAESNAQLASTVSGSALLAKPFVPGMLLDAVRGALDRVTARRAGG